MTLHTVDLDQYTIRTTDSERRLRVAIVDEELPYPAVTGKRIRTLNLLLRLAHRHDLTYLCHRNADPVEARRAEAFFRDRGIETVMVDRAVPPKSGPAFHARLLANLLSPLPYSVASHLSRPLRRAVEAHAASVPVDLWHCEWTPYAAGLRGLDAPTLVMAHNVESQIWQRYFETEKNPLKCWYIRLQWRKFVRFERWAMSAAALAVAVSDEDAAQLRHDFGAQRVTVVENGVDVRYFQPGSGMNAPHPLERNPYQILFLGSLDWRPNLDAVTLLLDRIFPAVRAQEPRARLVIVGRNPPDWLRRRGEVSPDIIVHANVADVRPFLAQSSVLAVPLRIGGGSRLKILEAIASGLPVVSTQIGAEGLRLHAGEHLDVVASEMEMPAALLRALHDPEEARARCRRGRRVVLDEYDWDGLARKLDQAWRQCAAFRCGDRRET
jgi:glycosyltransferase involved in cell wall biosynthesis